MNAFGELLFRAQYESTVETIRAMISYEFY